MTFFSPEVFNCPCQRMGNMFEDSLTTKLSLSCFPRFCFSNLCLSVEICLCENSLYSQQVSGSTTVKICLFAFSDPLSCLEMQRMSHSCYIPYCPLSWVLHWGSGPDLWFIKPCFSVKHYPLCFPCNKTGQCQLFNSFLNESRHLPSSKMPLLRSNRSGIEPGHARQALYCVSHSSRPLFLSFVFEIR
jgi:hypothetical protein